MKPATNSPTTHITRPDTPGEVDTRVNDANANVLVMLFEEHHRQLVAKRLKIHSVTEKTLAVFLIIAGWLVVGKDPMTPSLRGVIIGVVIVVGTSACMSIWTNNRSYYDVYVVLGGINEALGLFQPNKFLNGVTIYPESWQRRVQSKKQKGKEKRPWQRGELKGVLFHFLTIFAAGGLCVFAACMRQ